MKLKKLIIENFRGYQQQTEIYFDNLTAIIGRNDIGKTTIMDALGIFFDNKSCKYEPADKCIYSDENNDVSITCVFTDLPEEIILDDSSTTALNDEYLLNNDGDLQLSRIFTKGKGSGKYFICCFHPSLASKEILLSKKNSELKKLAENLGIEVKDKRSNVSLRKAIYETKGELECKDQQISLEKEDGKEILTQIQKYLPHFAIFRAESKMTIDRLNERDSDGDILKWFSEITSRLS